MFCRFFRFMISGVVDTGRSLSPTTRRHIRRCAACRRFHETSVSLAERLRREAAELQAPPRQKLAERILKAQSDACTAAHRLRIRWGPVAAAASLVVIATAAAVFVMRPGPGGPTTNRYEQGREIIAGLVPQEVIVAWPEVVDAPLAGEVENLTSDTESAVRFLVSCVAVDPTKR